MRKRFLVATLTICLAIFTMNFACSAGTVITQILTWLPTIEQAVVAILGGVTALKGTTVSPSDVAKIAAFQQSATVTLNDLTQAINAYKAAPAADKLAKINAVYQSLAANEAALLPALHIVDPSTVAKVNAGFGLVGVAISTVGSLIAELNPPPVAGVKKAKAAAPKMMTVPEFKGNFNSAMTSPVASSEVQAAFAGATIQ